MKTKYDVELLKTMALFENMTGAKLKDCFVNKERLIFVIEQGDMGKALGKHKGNIQRIEESLNRKIKIIEFNPDVLTFVRNLMFPLRILEMGQDEGIITVKGPDAKTKGLMIGARAQNLRNYEEIVRKYFEGIKEIKVI